MLTILVVEDNPLNLRLMQTILDQNGFHVLSAKNGVEALDAMASTTVALVLMDLHMPDMDGYETLQQIRDRKDSVQIPVIAVTGNTTQADEERAMEAGFSRFVRKPFAINELLDAMNQCIAGSPAP